MAVNGSVLVVGYGNALRTDDGLGWHVAERLAADPRFDGVEVLQRHQLTPELALDVSNASFVVLIDASHGPPAGTFTVTKVEPAENSETTWSHHLSPPVLVALAHELYGRAPDVFTVSCGAESLEMGDRLSPMVESAMPRLVDSVAALVAMHDDQMHAGQMTEVRGYAQFVDAVSSAMGLDDAVHRAGTTVVGTDERAGSAMVVAYAIASHTVLWCDPALVADLSPMTDSTRARSLAEFDVWAEAQGWEQLGQSHMQLLDEHGLRRPIDDAPHEVRCLDRTSEIDLALVDAFRATLSDEDRDEADLDDRELDEHIVAVIDDRGIAAFSSQQPFHYASNFADIAIATRPDMRRRGLGKIAVAALCRQIELRGHFPLYRRDAANAGSVALSASLGFVPVVEILAYKRPSIAATD